MSQYNDLVVRLLSAIEGQGGEINASIENGFAEGRAYRVNYRDTIPQDGNEIVLRYDNGGDTVLTLSTLEVQQGGVAYEIYSSDNVTETSPFDGTPLPIFPKNTMSTNPRLGTPSQVVVSTGGTATFTGEPNATVDLRSPASAGARASVVGGDGTIRGFGASTLYVRISLLEGINTDTKFTLKQEWVDL